MLNEETCKIIHNTLVVLFSEFVDYIYKPILSYIKPTKKHAYTTSEFWLFMIYLYIYYSRR